MDNRKVNEADSLCASVNGMNEPGCSTLGVEGRYPSFLTVFDSETGCMSDVMSSAFHMVDVCMYSEFTCPYVDTDNANCRAGMTSGYEAIVVYFEGSFDELTAADRMGLGG